VIPAHTPLPAICAQEAPKAIDLGVCVKWAAKDIGPEADIPEGWRLPTLAENIRPARHHRPWTRPCQLLPLGAYCDCQCKATAAGCLSRHSPGVPSELSERVLLEVQQKELWRSTVRQAYGGCCFIQKSI